LCFVVIGVVWVGFARTYREVKYGVEKSSPQRALGITG
jgi:hypothetical protein